jgi:hypothetical protein
MVLYSRAFFLSGNYVDVLFHARILCSLSLTQSFRQAVLADVPVA